jgi:hypothetical protein
MSCRHLVFPPGDAFDQSQQAEVPPHSLVIESEVFRVSGSSQATRRLTVSRALTGYSTSSLLLPIADRFDGIFK